MKKIKLPYSQRSDEDKVKSNWTKTCGLFNRGEYSVAIIRAVTTVELAVNLAIRAELVQKRQLPLTFVDHLLKRANGLRNKYNDLLLPIIEGERYYSKFKKLWKKVDKVNNQRNKIAHSGEFKGKDTAKEQLENTCLILNNIASQYHSTFKLKKCRLEIK
ncbi:MAG: hypothetical protein ACXACY_24195 [Candidatus Hodarchaeales archaeon]|jgi:hypothetical protein